MIFVVEVPHKALPLCWVSYGKAELVTTLQTTHADSYAYEPVTVQEIFTMYGVVSIADAQANNENGELGAIINLAQEHGMSATVIDDPTTGEWVINDTDEISALLEHNGHDLSSQSVYWTDEEALTAYQDDSNWCGHQGIEARRALRDSLRNHGIMTESIDIQIHSSFIEITIDKNPTFTLDCDHDKNMIGDEGDFIYPDCETWLQEQLEERDIGPLHDLTC